MPIANRPGLFLREINRALAAILTRTGTLMFATASYLIVDVARGEIRFSNAGGHPAPLHVCRREGEVAPLSLGAGRRPGPALGLLEDSIYPMAVSELCENDLLFLFTDGLYEVEGDDGEYYEQERLFEAVRERIELSGEALLEELIADVRKFSNRREFVDDICLVSVEVAKTVESPSVKEVPDWQI